MAMAMTKSENLPPSQTDGGGRDIPEVWMQPVGKIFFQRHDAAGEAEEYDGSRFLQCGHCAELTRSGVKGAAHRETQQGSAPT